MLATPPPGRGDADRGRAAHDEVFDCLGDFQRVTAFDLRFRERQLALVEQAQRAVGVDHGTDRVVAV